MYATRGNSSPERHRPPRDRMTSPRPPLRRQGVIGDNERFELCVSMYSRCCTFHYGTAVLLHMVGGWMGASFLGGWVWMCQ